MSAWPAEAWLFVKFMTFKSAAEMWNKNAVKKTHHYRVTYPRSEPSFPRPMSNTLSLSRTQKSRALCSVAAEVQMVCLYASLTQCCSFTSSLLCLLLFDSVHQCFTSVTSLSFFHFFLCPPFSSPHNNCLVVRCSSYFPFFWLAFLSAPSALWPSLTRPD